MSYLTASEAARRLGLSEATIRKKIRAGRISATKDGSTWRIPIEELDKVRAPSNGFEPATSNGLEPGSNAIERPSSPPFDDDARGRDALATKAEVLRIKLEASEQTHEATRHELDASERQSEALRADLDRTNDQLTDALASVRSLTDEVKALTAMVHAHRALPSPVGWLRRVARQVATFRI